MTAGSTSTWPKSGLTVASRVRLLFEPGFEIEAGIAQVSVPALEWIAGLGRPEAGLADRVGHDLEVASRPDVPDPFQAGETRDAGDILLGDPDETAPLLFPLDDPEEIDAPDVLVLLGEPKLVERDAHLHGPALRVHPGLRFPDAVPGVVLADVVRQDGILDRAGRIDGE